MIALASAALAACEGDTTLGTDPVLAGLWLSPYENVQVPFPDGTRTLSAGMRWSFDAAGHFDRRELLIDPVAALPILELVERGTYHTHGNRLELHVDSAYTRDQALMPAPVALQPANRNGSFGYEVHGDDLTITPVCPPAASCDPRFTQFERAFTAN
jgi:hypothetical protein